MLGKKSKGKQYWAAPIHYTNCYPLYRLPNIGCFIDYYHRQLGTIYKTEKRGLNEKKDIKVHISRRFAVCCINRN